MKDLVIGAITGYNFDAIEPWVNSLERSGFDGDKAMLCYNISFDVANELSKRGFKVFGFEQNEEDRLLEYTKPGFNVVVERFLHMAFVLRELDTKYRYIISTDVKDVIFQRIHLNGSKRMLVDLIRSLQHLSRLVMNRKTGVTLTSSARSVFRFTIHSVIRSFRTLV